MTQQQLHVTGIGNAIVDVLSAVDEDFIREEGLVKGAMELIDADRAIALSSKLRQTEQRSGGSAANTIAGLGALGCRAGYVGKVGKDLFGEVFARDLSATGVEFGTPPSEQGTATARCIVLITPDAQRTLCTYLGACIELGPEDVNREMIARSQVTYLEGYLWDPPRAKEAFIVAAEHAHAAGGRVALSLSDSFCVQRHRDTFLSFVHGHVDVLFANESELLGLYQTDDLNAAVRLAKEQVHIVAVTRGAEGCTVAWDGSVLDVPAEPAASVVDTTGAGDLFAAGFLHGLTSQRNALDCAVLGGLAAAEVIGHFGARPVANLKTLAASRLTGEPSPA